MKIALVIVSVVFIAVFTFQQIRLSSLQDEMKALEQSLTKAESNSNSKEDVKEHYELAVAMSHQQRYMQKLYFAGQNQNWKLADFYAHELSETMEDIIKHQVTDEGQDISELVKQMAYPQVEKLEQVIKEENTEKFVEGYQLLLRSCNNCHVASKHEFIKIEMPQSSSHINQSFQ